jgi:hypothetical protein
MAEVVSIENLKIKLKDIFCQENKGTRKYSEVWLSEVDFGGLYQNNKYVVNVKAEHDIDSCNNEIKHIVSDLFKTLSKEETEFIWKVDVYNSNEQIHCQSIDDIIVYKLSEAC